MRIAFVWDWKPDLEQTIQLNDGLQAALRVLESRGHTVSKWIDSDAYETVGEFSSIKVMNTAAIDVILFWSDFTRPNIKPLSRLGIPMAICFAGGEVITENTPLFQHIFVESQVYKTKLEREGYDNVSIAFGTNTELFKPTEQPKVFDTIFPATFAKWKRHDIYAPATKGLRSLAVGYMYPDSWEKECYEDCLKNDVMVLPHVSAETLHRLYAASSVVVITSLSSGGSQRTVLEAMAMNIPLVITDSDKFDYAWEHDQVFQVAPTVEAVRGIVNLILENGFHVNTREYILENWSEQTYADELERGLEAIL